MKKTNLTKTLYTSLIAGTLLSTTSLAAIPTTELIKAEPVKHASLKSAAKDSLVQSFLTIKIEINTTEAVLKTKIAEQKARINKNKPVTLAKISLIAD